MNGGNSGASLDSRTQTWRRRCSLHYSISTTARGKKKNEKRRRRRHQSTCAFQDQTDHTSITYVCMYRASTHARVHPNNTRASGKVRAPVLLTSRRKNTFRLARCSFCECPLQKLQTAKKGLAGTWSGEEEDGFFPTFLATFGFFFFLGAYACTAVTPGNTNNQSIWTVRSPLSWRQKVYRIFPFFPKKSSRFVWVNSLTWYAILLYHRRLQNGRAVQYRYDKRYILTKVHYLRSAVRVVRLWKEADERWLKGGWKVSGLTGAWFLYRLRCHKLPSKQRATLCNSLGLVWWCHFFWNFFWNFFFMCGVDQNELEQKDTKRSADRIFLFYTGIDTVPPVYKPLT